MILEQLNKTNQLSKSYESILKTYKKANKKYKQSILKKYGVTNIERIKSILENENSSKYVTKTELASLILNHPYTTINLSFFKKSKEKDIYDEILKTYNNSTPTEFSKKIKETVKKAFNGTERIVNGKHENKKDKFGRLFMVDLDQENINTNSDSRMILVTLENLNWASFKGTKYIVK